MRLSVHAMNLNRLNALLQIRSISSSLSSYFWELTQLNVQGHRHFKKVATGGPHCLFNYSTSGNSTVMTTLSYDVARTSLTGVSMLFDQAFSELSIPGSRRSSKVSSLMTPSSSAEIDFQVIRAGSM
jgi:hypothetical protein